MEPTENYLDTPDGKIHYLDWGGSGPQTHLLHANGFCAGTYSPFVRYLLDDLHVIASDVRGHGGSDLPDPKPIHHWNIFADNLKSIIEQIMSPPIIAMGHSLTFKVGAAERLKHKIADYELAVIADAGHFVPMGKPAECARVIADFVHRKVTGLDKRI